MKLFVYETLKSKHIQKETLGHTKSESRAALPGWQEIMIKVNGATWPTIVPVSHSKGELVKGDLIEVDKADLAKLDDWEDHYKRIKVQTSGGDAWAYVFVRPRS